MTEDFREAGFQRKREAIIPDLLRIGSFLKRPLIIPFCEQSILQPINNGNEVLIPAPGTSCYRIQDKTTVFTSMRSHSKTLISVVLTIFFSITSLGAAPASVEEIYVKLQSIQNQNLDPWSFEAIERNNSKTVHMIYRPVQNGLGMIELINIDGNPPTEKEKENFAKDHKPRKPKNMEKSGAELLDMMVEGSLQYRSSDNGLSTYSFIPQFKFDKTPSSAFPLTGQIEYDEIQQSIISFHVSTREPFSPKWGMSVINFDLKLTFNLHESGTVILQNTQTRFSGKAFWLIPIRMDTEVTYFDYKLNGI